VQRFRGGLVFKAHRLCVSLNSRLESNKEEGKQHLHGSGRGSHRVECPPPPAPLSLYETLQVMSLRVAKEVVKALLKAVKTPARQRSRQPSRPRPPPPPRPSCPSSPAGRGVDYRPRSGAYDVVSLHACFLCSIHGCFLCSIDGCFLCSIHGCFLCSIHACFLCSIHACLGNTRVSSATWCVLRPATATPTVKPFVTCRSPPST